MFRILVILFVINKHVMENFTLEKQVQLCGKTTFRFNNITKIHDAVLSLTVFMKYFDRKH